MVIQAEEQQSRMEKLKIKADSALLVNSPRSTLERRGKSNDSSSSFSSSSSSSELGEEEEEEKDETNKNYEKEKFPFLAGIQGQKGKFVFGGTLQSKKRVVVSKSNVVDAQISYQVCEATTEEEKQKCERSCATAMGVLERATGFPPSRLRSLSKRREGKDLDFVVDQKEEEDKEEWDKSREAKKRKRKSMENNFLYLYVVKKEEEDDVSHIQRIFGPVSEDVLAVARVKFTSHDSGGSDASNDPIVNIIANCDRFFITNKAFFITSNDANAALSFFSQLLLDGVHRVVVNRVDAQEAHHANNKKDVYFSLQCVPTILPENATVVSCGETSVGDSDGEIACSSMKTFTLRAALGCCLETPTETNLGVTARSGKCDYGKSNYTNNEEYVRFQPLSSDKANASLVTSLYDTLFASASIDGQIKSKIEEDVFVHDIVSEAFSSSIFDARNEETLTTKTCLKTVLQGTSVITPCFGVSPEHGVTFSQALDEWSKARYSLPSNVRDDHRHHQDSSIVARVKRQKVILLGSGAMNSLSLDAVVTEICREMDSEEDAFAGDTTLATATFLASASRGRKDTSNLGGIFFDSIAKHENSAHLLLLKLASFGIYPLRGTYDVSLFNFCGQPQQASLSSVPPSSDANVLFIATFQKKAFKIVNTLSLSNIDKLVEIEREAWISCPEMCTSVDTIRDRVLNNQAMNFAIFEMTGEDLEDTNDSLKGMMYTQFVKSTEDVSERNCWATKESARLKPFSSQTIQLLDVFADQRYSLENGGDVGMQLRDFVLHFAERVPMVETVCAVTRTRGFREVQQKAIKKIEEESERTQSSISEHLKASLAIPTYEQHVLSKEGGYNDRGLFLHVGAGAKILKVQYGWRPKDYENDGNGTLIEYKVEGLSWRRYSNVRTVKIGSSNSSSQSMVEAIAAITDDAHDEKIESIAA